MTKKVHSLLLLTAFISTVLIPNNLFAWGSLSHMWINSQVLKENSFSLSSRQRRMFIEQACGPDLAAMFLLNDSSADELAPLHSKAGFDVYSDMAHERGEADLNVSAIAFGSHLRADLFAHSSSNGNYANRKPLFGAPITQATNHICIEFLLDLLLAFENPNLLDYQPEFDGLMLTFVLENYASVHGGSQNGAPSQSIIDDACKKYSAALKVQKMLIKTIVKERPELYEQLYLLFIDRFDGLDGRSGLNKAVKSVKEFAKKQFECWEAQQNGSRQSSLFNSMHSGVKRKIEHVAEDCLVMLSRKLLHSNEGRVSQSICTAIIDELITGKDSRSRTFGHLLQQLLLCKESCLEQMLLNVQVEMGGSVEELGLFHSDTHVQARFNNYSAAFSKSKMSSKWKLWKKGKQNEYFSAFLHFHLARLTASIPKGVAYKKRRAAQEELNKAIEGYEKALHEQSNMLKRQRARKKLKEARQELVNWFSSISTL